MGPKMQSTPIFRPFQHHTKLGNLQIQTYNDTPGLEPLICTFEWFKEQGGVALALIEYWLHVKNGGDALVLSGTLEHPWQGDTVGVRANEEVALYTWQGNIVEVGANEDIALSCLGT